MRGWLASSSVILAGGVLVVGSAMALDRARPPDKVAADRVSFPDAERLRPLCFGFTEVAADLVWIQTLLYYSAHINLDQQFPWLDRMSETALDLDPRFAGAYRWCSATATWKTSNRTSISEVDFLLANHYAELGMRRMPEMKFDASHSGAAASSISCSLFSTSCSMASISTRAMCCPRHTWAPAPKAM